MPEIPDGTPVPAILLFVKAPRPGAAKTRLVPYLTPAAAADLAAAMGRDAVRLARACLPQNGRLVIAYAPDDGWLELHKALDLTAPYIALKQHGADLGERMTDAVDVALRDHSLAPVVVIGADCPLLPSGAIREAFAHLITGASDVVLGPAEDGGYYLAGLREPFPALFAETVWSVSTVLAATSERARRLGLRLFTDLPHVHDIDTPADLVRLRDVLAADPARAEQSPQTARWLRENPLPPFTASVTSVSDEAEHP